MTEHDQAFDALVAAEPGAEPLDRRMVDLAVARERGNRRGDETPQIKGFHGFLRLDRCWPDRPRTASDRVLTLTGDPPLPEDSDHTFQI